MIALRKKEEQLQAQIQQQEMAAYGNMFGEMAELTGAFSGEQSGLYKGLFAASKVFNIASTLSAAFPAIAKVWSSAPFPANMAAVATITASTGALSAAAQAVQLTGIAHNGMDSIPREGTWVLDQGERVLSSGQNKDLTSYLDGNKNNQSQASGVVVNLIDQAGVNTQVEESEDDLGRKVIDIVLMDQRSGGEMTAGYQGMWGLNRKGQF